MSAAWNSTPEHSAFRSCMRAKGVALEIETYSWGTIANFTDPDGNLCSLRDEASFQ